ncbi:MAG: AAA family ATPase [Candidatus Pacearchaeota archaeon]
MGKVIGVVSFKGGVGKTVTAINLAAALVRHKKKTLIIEGNFLAPNLGVYLGLFNPDITLKEVLQKNLFIFDAIYEHKSGIHVLPSNFFRGIHIERFKSKIKELKKTYDFLILDAGSNFTEEIAATLAVSDSILLVTTPDYPTLLATLRAADMIRKYNIPIEGVVINKIRGLRFELTPKEIENKVEVKVLAKIKDDNRILKSISKFSPLSGSSFFNRNLKEYNKLARYLIR